MTKCKIYFSNEIEENIELSLDKAGIPVEDVNFVAVFDGDPDEIIKLEESSAGDLRYGPVDYRMESIFCVAGTTDWHRIMIDGTMTAIALNTH